MAQLFQILDTSTRRRLPSTYPSKPAAKAERKRLNQEANAAFRFVVTPGPDHHRFHHER